VSDTLDRLTAALADRYRIERELGAGGMATVYLAHDIKHDRDVAIKVLHPDLGAALGADRFLTEIRTTARLQHPHILPLLDSGEAGGLLYYVMPLVTGETLRTRLERDRQLPVGNAIRIAREVADALGYAHELGVIHRDIKPENILLQGGHALVADFGIALAVQTAGGQRLTQTGLSLGTPQYMSPEQAMGERAIDARSDIYALGAVTYEMLAGDPPFTGSSVQAVVAKVLTEKPSPIRTVRDTVPESIEEAVLTALAKLPADRWPSAAAFAAALDEQREPARSRSMIAASVPAPRWSIRAPLPWAIAFGLATIMAVWGWWPRTSAVGPPVVRLELQPVMGTTFAFPLAGVATELAVSPDGGRVIYAATASPGGWMLYLRTLDQLTSRAIPGTTGAFNPEFSPDGRWIAFRSADGKLKKIGVDGTALTTLCTIDNGGSVGAGLSWVSDKEIVFARGTYSEGRGLWRVSADGGEPVQFSKFNIASGERLQLSPRAVDHGRLILYSSTVASNADLTIAVVETATGKSTVLAGLPGARAIGLVDGFVLYVRNDGALMAAPFDARRLRAGVPMQISDSIAVPASAWSTPIALSANGSLVYQKGGVTSQLVTLDNGVAHVLLDSAQNYLHPRLSPDGHRIAVEVQGAAGVDIWIADLANHTAARLTRGGFNNRPEWSPDGRQVLFASSTRTPADALWMQPADGSGDATLVLKDVNPIREGVVTPDGKTIVYRVDTPNNNRDIYRASLSGDRTPVALLAGINDDKQPRVSPDSRWFAYVSNESGREEVYVRALSPDGGRVQVSTDGGGEPLWSHDGRRLFYRAGTGIVAATIVTSPVLAVTGRSRVFDGPYATDVYHPNYDVEPDDRTFVVVRPVANDRELVLVVNWLQELRQRTQGRTGAAGRAAANAEAAP
jgi:Tol biopolymer transport system component